jgi:hypothetical protein
LTEEEIRALLAKLKINNTLMGTDLDTLEELVLSSISPPIVPPIIPPVVPILDLQKYITDNNYVVIDKLWELKTPLKLHNNLILDFRWGELRAIELMDNILDGRNCVDITLKGDGLVQGNGKAKIPVDLRWDTQWVTSNKIYDIHIKGGTDVGLDFTNNSEFLLSGQWDINGAVNWSGPSPICYSDYGIRCKSSGGQNTILGGGINGCKKGDLFMSGGTLKIFGGAYCTKGSEGNIVIQGDNPGNWLIIFGSWIENNGKPNIKIIGTNYSIGMVDLHGVQFFTGDVPNIMGIGTKRLDFLGIEGGSLITNNSDYCVDADIWVLSEFLLCHGNWKKSFANPSRVNEYRHKMSP